MRFRNAISILEIVLVEIAFRHLDQASYKMLLGLNLIDKPTELTMPLIFWLSTVSTLLLTLTLIGLQKLRGKTLEEFGLNPNQFPTLSQIGSLTVSALLFQLLIGQAIDPLLESVFNAPKSLPKIESLPMLFLGYAISFIGGGFREELFYRGYLLTRISRLSVFAPTIQFYIALLIQAALFGLAHWYQGPAGVVGTTIMGLGFTGVYLLTRNLWSAILFHAIFDVFGFTAIYLGY